MSIPLTCAIHMEAATVEAVVSLWVIGVAAAALVWWLLRRSRSEPAPADLSALPEHFVVFDLETTGLDPSKHEIIEIGAIRVHRDAEDHQTFQALIVPKRRVPKKIIEITGITNEMVKSDGLALADALAEFRSFIGDLPLVAFNAAFDDSFLAAACEATSTGRFNNETCCALKLARRAWPYRTSFRLSELAKDGNPSAEGTHRALSDCRRTMVVYAAAARAVGAYR
jgi:DNA polymerase III epsilon subunit family exonuclease